jgi:integrase
MAIFQKGKNWYIDYYVKGHRKRKKIGTSKKLAEQVLKDIHVKIAKSEYLGIFEEKSILFEDYAPEYLAYSKANKAESTYNRRDVLSVNHLSSFFKGRYLFEIKPQMIEEYKSERLKKVAPATVNRELTCLKHMFTMAIEWEYIRTNTVKVVKRLKEPPGRLRYLREKEVECLIDKCRKHLRPIVVTALNTGMRKSEILNLRWADVDLKNLRITINNSKNNERRIVPINKNLHKELSPLLKRANGNFVFSNSYSKPFGSISKGFSAAIKRAGIEDFRFHDLRHTFGSYMVMQGVDIRTVQQLLGHKDIKMTMRYSHLSPEHVKEAIGRLDNVWTLFGHQSEISKKKSIATI